MYYIRFTYSGKMLESPNYLGRLARYFLLKYMIVNIKRQMSSQESVYFYPTTRTPRAPPVLYLHCPE